MTHKKFGVADAAAFADPRAIPAYSVADASHYLNIPPATIRAWVMGQEYAVAGGAKRRFRRVIDLPRPDVVLLSFYNLAEAHVLRSLRECHGVRLKIVRAALDYLRKEFGWKRPLIEQAFRTDGVALFVERLGQLVEAPKSVLIDPRFAFGRPILRKSHVATAVVAERYKAGDSIDALAEDYGCSRLEIEEGIRCELRLQVAA